MATSTGNGKEIPQPSFLLNLPPELLTKILGILDPSTFSIVLMTCKTIRRAVINNPHVIHDQLRSVPGLHLCNPQHCLQNPLKLLEKFNKRAAKHALNGAGVLGDMDCIVGKKFNVKTHKAIIGPIISPEHNQGRWVACYDQNCRNLVVYQSPKWEFEEPILTKPIPIETDWMELDDARVALIQFEETQGAAGRHVFLQVLYSFGAQKPPVIDMDDSKEAITLEAILKPHVHTMRLVVYDLPCENFGGDCDYCVKPCHEIDIPSPIWGSEPMAMAFKWEETVTLQTTIGDEHLGHLPHMSHFAVAWELTQKMADEQQRLPNGNFSRRVEYVNQVMVSPFSNKPDSRQNPSYSIIETTSPIKTLDFEMGRLVVFVKNQFSPSHYIKGIGVGTSSHVVRSCSKAELNTMDAFFGYWYWPKLGYVHHHETKEDIRGRFGCVIVNVHIGYISWPQWPDEGFFLTQSQAVTYRCINPSAEAPFRGENLENVVVAKFVDTAGRKAHTRQSERSVVAVSDTGCRVAIATWDRVLLYSVMPEAFIDPSTGSLALKLLSQHDSTENTKNFIGGTKSDDSIRQSQLNWDRKESKQPFSPTRKRKRRPGYAFQNYKTEFPLQEEAEASVYVTNAGMGYYRNNLNYYKSGRRIVALRPTVLPAKGVVYSLKFLNDDALLAFTDRGFVRWYWGPQRSGSDKKMDEFPLKVTGGCGNCKNTLCLCLVRRAPGVAHMVLEDGGETSESA